MANPTYILIQSVTLTTTAATVTLGSGGTIPAIYTDLKVACSVRTDRSLLNDYLKLTINSGSSYSGIQLLGSGSGASSGTFSGIGANQYAGELNANTSTSSTFTSIDIYFPNYLSSNQKSYSVDSAMENNASTAYSTLDAGLWSGTAAINQLTFAPGVGSNFMANTSFYLYGIKNS